MGWLRALVGGSSPAATGAGAATGASAQQPQAQPQAHPQPLAGSDADGTPAVMDKGLQGLVDSPGDFHAAKDPASLSGGGAPAPGEPHMQFEMGTPQPGEGGEEVLEEWEDEEEAYYYGADALRQRAWRHTENQVLLWVAAVLVAAIAINIGVSGEQGRGLDGEG